MKNYFLAILIYTFFFLPEGYCQLKEEFENDLSGWSGDLQDFTITTDHRLRLMAAEAGSSVLWTPVTLPEEWETTVRITLEFEPSNSNKCRIYLLKDNPMPDTGNGYFLEVGENGSDDAISIFSVRAGEEALIGRGSMGAVASQPVDININLSRKQDGGLWQLGVDYEGGILFVPEMEFRDENINLTGEAYLTLECIYTSTRRDRFYFDDIYVQPYQEDITPPQLTDAVVKDAHSIDLTFNEILEEAIAADVNHYSIEGTGIHPVRSTVMTNKVTLDFSEAFASGPPFSILIEGLEDLKGNVAERITVADLLYAVTPEPGDLYINEVLFDPFPGEEDFVELYNASEKALSLLGLEIHNTEREDHKSIISRIIMKPMTYLAISPDTEILRDRYQPPAHAIIVSHDLPALNNDHGNVSLIYSGVSLDSFDYNENLHSPVISDTEGVSLERISINLPVNNASTWTSAPSIYRNATPGYANGSVINLIDTDDRVTLRNKIFSPNGDGDKDYLILDYNLDKPGYIASVTIFSDTGYPVKKLINNVSLATNGFITWDGITDDGRIGRIGVYIVIADLFHPDGDKVVNKFAAVLVKDL